MSAAVRLAELEAEASAAVNDAADAETLQQAKARFLGRKGQVQELFRAIPTLPPDQRKSFGQQINALKETIEGFVAERSAALKAADRAEELSAHSVDITLPGRELIAAPPHPITATLDEIEALFSAMGFQVADGPEIELDRFNFEALNFPADHPARDMQDTFFVEELGPNPAVLRTHTSPVQIRAMLQYDPPVRVICPGRVYRCDTPDASHSPVFHQVEGLMVGEQVSFAELKGILQHAIQSLFGTDKLRFRPSFFPFTEPSAEVDMACVFCDQGGCPVCKKTGWIEILGAGMVDPEVFAAVGYPPDKVTGWAFGMGIERIAMLRHGIRDIRLFFEGDLRFLSQFDGMGAL